MSPRKWDMCVSARVVCLTVPPPLPAWGVLSAQLDVQHPFDLESAK
jgi:hypothetical protein